MNIQQSPTTVRFSRRDALLVVSAALFSSPHTALAAAQAGTEEKFSYLSTNGNSNCSAGFRESIATMPETARLRGSCCGPMALHRYREQVEGLKEFAKFPEVPPDPYDIDAGFAARMLGEYKVELNRVDIARYNTAMETSAEGGPCCCKCWRWEVFGGMGKVLIQKRQADSKTLARIWDLTDGCGGDSHTH